MDKKEFIGRIKQDPKSQDLFVDNLAENLGILFFEKPRKEIEDKRKNIQEVLGDGTMEELKSMTPELLKLLTRVESKDFLRYKITQEDSTKTLYEVFQGQEVRSETLRHPEHIKEEIYDFRKGIVQKMTQNLSEDDIKYFFSHTLMEVVQENDTTWKIVLGFPSDPNKDEEKQGTFICQKFDEEFSKIIIKNRQRLLRKIPIQLKVEYRLISSKDQYHRRKQQIRDYKPYQIQEETGSPIKFKDRKQSTQLTLDRGDNNITKYQELVVHEGNKEADSLGNLRIDSHTLGHNLPMSEIIFYSTKEKHTGKMFFVRQLVQKLQTFYPNITMKEIAGEYFYQEFIAARKPNETMENLDQKKARLEAIKNKYTKNDILIIHNLEELTNKIATQKLLLEIIKSQRKKVILVCNSDINKFQKANMELETGSKKGFIPELLSFIAHMPRAETQPPNVKSCGRILLNMLNSKYPESKNRPENLVYGIAKNIPYPAQYPALVTEIGIATSQGKDPLTIDLTKNIIKKRISLSYSIPFNELETIIARYINENETYMGISTAKKKAIQKKFFAYFAKKTESVGIGNKRSIEEIAQYLGISMGTTSTYIQDIMNNATHDIMEIEKKLDEHKQYCLTIKLLGLEDKAQDRG